ncbi:DEAD/DEAH box helicase [Paenibacillus anaericanus]|uniref:DEAD/DEAH box helicase n=1 Tax=Paenibacillus anaericanus TaxID=170367 RepID=A0A433XZF8_9BACL|nr:DEAD/DEAH box helicase [Paenibacillus anaericanus]RUT40367.1 DEAD/DEAH box helicase [Paenibacillus anaericanus]
MTFLNRLVDKALKDPYVSTLIVKLEKQYANHFIGKNTEVLNLTGKEYLDLLRFADILCRSEKYEARNTAYKIISLLHAFYNDDQMFKLQAYNVLVKLGNFPSIEIVLGETKVHSDEIVIDRIVKETYQAAPGSSNIFTDTQYKLFEKMKDSNHFSFSGPTSFGKSFIFESFIKYLIEKKNGSDNIALLVPTRALINQVSMKLKNVINNKKYKILTKPVVPLLYKQSDTRFIFVLTPERLISYLSEANPVINYLLVDEAHKLLSETDTRAPLFYHALMIAKRKSINLYFSSPNVPNTEIFLQLVGNSVEETLSIKENSVAQNRFFIDCIEKRAVYFSEYGDEQVLEYSGYASDSHTNLKNAINILGENSPNIIYCNTKDDTIQYALEYAKTLSYRSDNELGQLINLVQDTMHEEYYLVDCLKKGVAYHFGGLPQRIREKIELLFQKKIIKNIFCTSTLLEGVNLPAKNIFILSNAIGLTKLSKIDFWNLAGRAGRLTEDLSGNIICLRIIDKRNRWENPDKDLQVIKDKSVGDVSSVLMTNQGKFYINIGNSIRNEPFTRKHVTENEKRMLDSYGNILAYHALSKTDSILRSKFIDRNNQAKEIINYLEKFNKVPEKILSQSSTIKLVYQNKILSSSMSLMNIPERTGYQECLDLLNTLCDLYNWEKEESGGRNPLVRSKAVLGYYAVLMSSWINSQPLNVIIKKTINYFDENSKQISINNRDFVLFEKENRAHINHIVNNVVSDIENLLRFKIKIYVKNYVDLLNIKYQKDEETIDIPNWDNYLEYGTTDLTIIELQNLGFQRHIASFLKNNYLDFFVMENGIITDFLENELKEQLQKSKYMQEYEEVSNTLGWS